MVFKEDPLRLENNSTLVYAPDVISFADYSPYGTLLDGRHGNDDTYRYGFQGQERDDEIKGAGNSYNYEYRMHDPRIGRFFAVDPLAPKYPYLTPYQFASNSPIYMLEVEGLEGKIFHYSVWWNNNGDRQSKLEWTELNDGDRGGLFNASPHVAYPGTRVVEYNQRAIHYWNSKGENYDTKYETIKTGPSGTVNISSTYFDEINDFNWDQENGLEGKYDKYNTGGKLTMPYYAFEKFSAPFLKNLEETTPPKSYTGAATPCDGFWQSFIGIPFRGGAAIAPALTSTEVSFDVAARQLLSPSRSGMPKTITAMTSGTKVSIGYNGSPAITAWANNLGTPSQTLESWSVLQCAEPKALNSLLLQGAPRSSISSSTLGLNKGTFYTLESYPGLRFNYGRFAFPKAPCKNCAITTKGIGN